MRRNLMLSNNDHLIDMLKQYVLEKNTSVVAIWQTQLPTILENKFIVVQNYNFNVTEN